MARPPRRRKSRKPEAPQHDVAVVIPPVDIIPLVDGPLEEPMHDASASASTAPPQDELAEVDAGWD
jgi:hypothetical protein